MSSHPGMVKIKRVKIRQATIRKVSTGRVLQAFVFIALLSLLMGASASAYGQGFTLTANGQGLQPAAVDPGGSSTATLALTSVGGFNGSVSLTCAVTGNQTPLPTCLVSPSADTPTATVSLTVSTTSINGTAPAGEYTITVTGTSGSETPQTATLFLNVVDVPQDYTITVSKAISPSSVTAGGGAQATILVTPISSYSGTVTLSCASITPAVEAAPICAFAAADGSPSVAVTSGSPNTAVLTVSTYGTTQTMAKGWSLRVFYGFWLALPGLALVCMGAGAKRRSRFLGIFLLLAVASSLLMLPSCGSSSTTSNNSSGFVTPKNSYTFTITGVDQSGVGPSNTTTSEATVSLTVN